MTRLQIQETHFSVFLLIFLLAQVSVCNATVRENRDSEILPPGQSDVISSNVADGQPSAKKTLTETNVKTPDVNSVTSKNITSIGSEKSPSKGTVQNNSTVSVISSGGHLTSLSAGALKRGFYVLIGLSVLVIAYLVFRSFRISKTRAQMIRKYGVLTHRQDVEMRPLPLDEEDDDDTTVFDVSNVSTHNSLQSSP